MAQTVYPKPTTNTPDAAFTHVNLHTSTGQIVRAAAVAATVAAGILPSAAVAPQMNTATTAPALVNPMPPVPWVGILPAEFVKGLRGLGPAEKAERVGEWIGWTGGEEYKDSNGMPLWCAGSPISGRHYLISYSVTKGAYVCSCDGCRRHGDCYHLESWYPLFGDDAAPYLKAREEAARERAASATCRRCNDAGRFGSYGFCRCDKGLAMAARSGRKGRVA